MNFRPCVTGRSLEYKLNRIGSRTEPWGRPLRWGLQELVSLPMCTLKRRSRSSRPTSRVNQHGMLLLSLSQRWQHVMKSNIGSELQFLPTPPAFDAPLGGSPSEYCRKIWYGKTRMAWLPDGEKFWCCVYSFWQNSRMWHTDRRTPHDGTGCACIAKSINNINTVKYEKSMSVHNHSRCHHHCHHHHHTNKSVQHIYSNKNGSLELPTRGTSQNDSKQITDITSRITPLQASSLELGRCSLCQN